MACVEIENGIICFANVDFKCPYCNKEYNDSNDFYYDRMMKNKSHITKIKCECGKSFGLTGSFKGHVSFKLK